VLLPAPYAKHCSITSMGLASRVVYAHLVIKAAAEVLLSPAAQRAPHVVLPVPVPLSVETSCGVKGPCGASPSMSARHIRARTPTPVSRCHNWRMGTGSLAPDLGAPARQERLGRSEWGAVALAGLGTVGIGATAEEAPPVRPAAPPPAQMQLPPQARNGIQE
jgi:hypothetical protein